MVLMDVLQWVLQAQGCESGDGCPASSFNAIAAAWATQGYYQQADLLVYIVEDGLGLLAPLIYLLAGMAGIISMVLGAPPRNYVWFFIGPAVFGWLVDSRVEAYGVRHMSANDVASVEDQKEVWRMSEIGLRNSQYVQRYGITVNKDAQPSSPARVGLFFLWVDDFASDIVRNLVKITGVYSQLEGSGSTNIDQAPNGSNTDPKNWSILSDLKWAKIEDITAVKLRDGDTRDAFVTFLASECGDVFARHVDQGKWVAATSGKGRSIPNSVFIGNGNSATTGIRDLWRDLRQQAIPIPDSYRSMILKGETGSDRSTFYHSAQTTHDEIKNFLGLHRGTGGMPCDGYLHSLVHAFRYEAGHMYHHLVGNAPGQFSDKPDDVVYNLLYGWGIADRSSMGDPAQARKQYLINLLFVHLLRNELSIAPKPVDVRYSASRESANYVDAFARTVGSKVKYGEVYSWALMVPYIQGVVLYVLAMAYPFAAMMVIVPGWHKVIITWASFWIWVKTWDLGFAVVKVIERGLWGMLGNNTSSIAMNNKIIEMELFAQGPTVQCAAGGGGGGAGTCPVPEVIFGGGEYDGMGETLRLFSRALALAGSLDLDLQNSYYIYIMSALYFSVPAVTGQIVLGAKAGASSLVGGFISGFSDKVSGGVQSGYTGDMAQRVKTNVGSLGQAATAKSMRASGLGLQALQESNAGMVAEGAGLTLSTKSNMASAVGEAYERGNKSKAGAMSTAPKAIEGGYEIGKGIGSGYGAFKSKGGPAKAPGEAAGESVGGAAGSAAGGHAGGPAGDDATKGGAASKVGPTSPGWGKAKAGAQKAGDIGLPLAQNDLMNEGLMVQNEIAAGNQARTLAGFAAGAEKMRAGAAGQRIGEFAAYNAESKAWQAKRDFGNQIASDATIGGLFAGGVDPGNKPNPGTNAAMSGILDTYSGGGGGRPPRVASSASGAASFANKGGAFMNGGNGSNDIGENRELPGVKGAYNELAPLGPGAIRDQLPRPTSHAEGVVQGTARAARDGARNFSNDANNMPVPDGKKPSDFASRESSSNYKSPYDPNK